MKLIAILSVLFLWAGQSQANCNRVFFAGTNTDALVRKTEDLNRISIEIFAEIKKRVGCVFNETTLSFSRAAEELRNHRIDMFAFGFATDSWNEFANPETIYGVNRILLVRKKFYSKHSTVADYFKNPKIKFAAISGANLFYRPEELTALSREKRVSYSPFPDGTVELLKDNKVQATFTSPVFLGRYLKQYQIEKEVEIIPDPQVQLHITLFLSKNRIKPPEREIFARAIADMKKDGTLKGILLKYVSQKDLDRFYSF